MCTSLWYSEKYYSIKQEAAPPVVLYVTRARISEGSGAEAAGLQVSQGTGEAAHLWGWGGLKSGVLVHICGLQLRAAFRYPSVSSDTTHKPQTRRNEINELDRAGG